LATITHTAQYASLVVGLNTDLGDSWC